MDHHHIKVGLSRGGNYNKNNNHQQQHEEDMDLRQGPWTVEEDFTLINNIAHHGEGRWNFLARSAGIFLCVMFHLFFLYLTIDDVDLIDETHVYRAG